MTNNIESRRRVGRAAIGFAAGACAGMPVAFTLLTLYCFITMGSDCRDGYIAMILLAPIGIVACAVIGLVLAAKSTRATGAIVGGTVGVWAGFAAGFATMGAETSGLGLVVMPALIAGAGAAIGWRLAGRVAARQNRAAPGAAVPGE